MRATGIVRRIDDLGRIVIPREVRKILRIREGDPLEIFTDKDQLILVKYSPIGSMSDFAKSYVSALFETSADTAMIVDRDMVVACAGYPKCEYNPISTQLTELIDSRTFKINNGKDVIPLMSNDTISYAAQIICPILAEGDPIGAVILTTGKVDTVYGDTESKLVKTAARFIQKQMEQ